VIDEQLIQCQRQPPFELQAQHGAQVARRRRGQLELFEIEFTRRQHDGDPRVLQLRREPGQLAGPRAVIAPRNRADDVPAFPRELLERRGRVAHAQQQLRRAAARQQAHQRLPDAAHLRAPPSE